MDIQLGLLVLTAFLVYIPLNDAASCKDGEVLIGKELTQKCEENPHDSSCCHGNKCIDGYIQYFDNLLGCDFGKRCYKEGEVLQRQKAGSPGTCYKSICNRGQHYFSPLFQYEGCWVKIDGKHECIAAGRSWKDKCKKKRCVLKKKQYTVRTLDRRSRCKGVSACMLPNTGKLFSIEDPNSGKIIKNCECKCRTKNRKPGKKSKCRSAVLVHCPPGSGWSRIQP